MNLHQSRTELLFLLKSSNSVRDWCKFNQTNLQNGTLEAPGSPPGATLKKVSIPGAEYSRFLGSFLEPETTFWVHFV